MKNLDGIYHPGLNVKQVNRGPFTISELCWIAIRGQFRVPVGMGSHAKFLVSIPPLQPRVKGINMSLSGRLDFVSNACIALS